MSTFRVIGAGSPLVDYTACVDDLFLQQNIPGGKGGTLHIDGAERRRIFSAVTTPVLRTPGGAAANTISALGKLQVDTAFFGKTGNDEDGEFFRKELAECGVSTEYLIRAQGETGYCISLVTPDAERTMRSDLGISTALSAADWQKCDFSGFSWLLSEGYMLQIPGFENIFAYARKGNCSVALDLSSIEIARQKRNELPDLLKTHVDMVLCNRDEAAALTGNSDPEQNLRYLAGSCRIAIVKLGADGSLIMRRNESPIRIPACDFGAAVDTTAAGDHYAAGIFYGLSRGFSLEKCGRCGAILGGAAAAVNGSRLTGEMWRNVMDELDQIKD